MSNQDLPPPYIAEPPIYDEFFESDGKTISSPWQNWINSITQVTGFVIVHDFLLDGPGGSRSTEVALLQAISMSTADRNMLDNARDGTIIYNTDSAPPAFNFRVNGTWVTFSPIPA